MQNAAVSVVIELFRGVDAQANLELPLFTILRPGDYFYEFRRTSLQAENVEGFPATEAQTLCILAFLELQRQHTHTDQVGAVNALKTLGNDCLDAQQHGALGRPVA